jgi:hypothetical protein
MAKADDASSTNERRAMPSRPRTLRSDLDRLPQFEPDHTFRLDAQRESVLPFFPESRARQIRDVLSSAMKDHVRKARFQGKPTSLERFLRNAMLAIATYESRSLRRYDLPPAVVATARTDVLQRRACAYDRGRASKLVKEVRVALWAFQQTLERTVEWEQLDRYLESLFVAARKQNEWQHDEREGKRSAAKLTSVRRAAVCRAGVGSAQLPCPRPASSSTDSSPLRENCVSEANIRRLYDAGFADGKAAAENDHVGEKLSQPRRLGDVEADGRALPTAQRSTQRT